MLAQSTNCTDTACQSRLRAHPREDRTCIFGSGDDVGDDLGDNIDYDGGGDDGDDGGGDGGYHTNDGG